MLPEDEIISAGCAEESEILEAFNVSGLSVFFVFFFGWIYETLLRSCLSPTYLQEVVA